MKTERRGVQSSSSKSQESGGSAVYSLEVAMVVEPTTSKGAEKRWQRGLKLGKGGLHTKERDYKRSK